MSYLQRQTKGSELEKFCRNCGARIETSFAGRSSKLSIKDPDELVGNGIGAVIVGDGLLIVAIILSAIQSSVSSLLWLLLLIPAFFCYGRGFADVLLARQIRRRTKQASLDRETELLHTTCERPLNEVLSRSRSGQLATVPSVTEKTTRHLD